MVSDKYRCIFVEVPKTGSTSVRSILGKPIKPHLNLWEIKTLMESYWPIRGGRRDRIMEAVYMTLPKETRRARGARKFDSYFKFGFVRNPWDRAVSLYERLEGEQMRHQMSFEEFVDWMQYSSATCEHPSPHRYQLDWFVDPNGKVIADFIGRFERIEEDWKIVATRLGVNPTLPHRRENPRARHYGEYYTPRSRDIILERFRVDVETFGYSFEN